MLRFEVGIWVCSYLYRISNKRVYVNGIFDYSHVSRAGCGIGVKAILNLSRRRADFRGAKLLSSPSISASHHSAQRQSMSKMQAAALNNSRACYWTPLAACQYCLCLGLFSQLLAMPGRLGGGRSLVRSTWEGFVESLCMSTSLLLDFWKENVMRRKFLLVLWAAEVKMDSPKFTQSIVHKIKSKQRVVSDISCPRKQRSPVSATVTFSRASYFWLYLDFFCAEEQ